MNFGYLIFVSTSDSVDYLNLAYALAVSIKNTQKEGYDRVALVIDNIDEVSKVKSPWVFDKIIAANLKKGWDSRSWMDQLSPWDETVCLDADMLFTRDYSHWIDYLIKNCDLYIPKKAYTYRNEIITDDYYRETFIKNNLPNLYSFFTFFKRDYELSKSFFNLGRDIINNPVEFKNLFLEKHKPKIVGTDEAFALSAKILDVQDQISYDLDFPKVVHMKPMIQNWPWFEDSWKTRVGMYIEKNGNIKIGNYQQHSIVHYVDKTVITDNEISILENILWKK